MYHLRKVAEKAAEKVVPKGSDPTGEYSVNFKRGSHNAIEYPEKRVVAKPFCVYPYAFYDKYGGYAKPCCINPTYVINTLPRMN